MGNEHDIAIKRPSLWLTILTLLLTAVAGRTSADSIPQACPVVKIEVEQLPDLHIPRASHQVFMAGGEYVVAGGHTNGFIPTPTAEYLKDGEWHVMQMVYNHDFGYSVVLKSGKVLLGGGSSEPIGIGQTFLAEMYDPQTHTFDGFGSMEQKRAGASGLELDSGSVVIAGNWYHNDGIEVFDGKKHFTYIKDVAEGRSGPFIFRTAKDNAIVFSGFNTKGDSLHSSTADRLRGEAVSIPLFETWHPFGCTSHRNAESFIGDESRGVYAYLFPVRDSTSQVAIAKIENGDVSLLPTVCPVPMKTRWGGIEYYSAIIADQAHGRAYLVGANADMHTQPEKGFRHYVLRIDYAEASEGRPAPLTLYYTDPLHDTPDYTPVLTPEGNLLIAGGLTTAVSNFAPSGHAYVLCISDGTANLSESNHLWWWLAALLAAVTVAVAGFLVRKYRRHKAFRLAEASAEATAIGSTKSTTDLMQRINELMEQEQLYKNVNLKVTDVAVRLGTNNRYVSDCIRQCEGTTFSNFVNDYRVRHAQQLMRTSPKKKVSSFYLEAGFANESTFFRTFKASTGMTPKEWLEQLHHQ